MASESNRPIGVLTVSLPLLRVENRYCPSRTKVRKTMVTMPSSVIFSSSILPIVLILVRP